MRRMQMLVFNDMLALLHNFVCNLLFTNLFEIMKCDCTTCVGISYMVCK